MKLIKLTEHVFIYRYDKQTDYPNIGIIKTDNETFLVDAGISKRHVESIKKAMNLENIKTPSKGCVTHFHYDHSYGMFYWKIPFYVCKNTQKELERISKYKYTLESLNQMIKDEIEHVYMDDITFNIQCVTDKQFMNEMFDKKGRIVMKVLAFGEILLRLTAPGYTKLFQKDNLEATFCGGEANVAVSLSNFGLDSAFITKVPKGEMGQAAVNSLRYFGVDINDVLYGDGRLGLYYLEKGASQRPSKVIYDRAFSAIALARKEEFDWDNIFQDVNWFHWSGILVISIIEKLCGVVSRRRKL